MCCAPEDVCARDVTGQRVALQVLSEPVGRLPGGEELALGTTRVLSGLLYRVGTTDPLTHVAVPLVLLLTALTAAYFPARRATRADPMTVLREE